MINLVQFIILNAVLPFVLTLLYAIPQLSKIEPFYFVVGIIGYYWISPIIWCALLRYKKWYYYPIALGISFASLQITKMIWYSSWDEELNGIFRIKMIHSMVCIVIVLLCKIGKSIYLQLTSNKKKNNDSPE